VLRDSYVSLFSHLFKLPSLRVQGSVVQCKEGLWGMVVERISQGTLSPLTTATITTNTSASMQGSLFVRAAVMGIVHALVATTTLGQEELLSEVQNELILLTIVTRLTLPTHALPC
jgi:hypothetical protein